MGLHGSLAISRVGLAELVKILLSSRRTRMAPKNPGDLASAGVFASPSALKAATQGGVRGSPPIGITTGLIANHFIRRPRICRRPTEPRRPARGTVGCRLPAGRKVSSAQFEQLGSSIMATDPRERREESATLPIHLVFQFRQVCLPGGGGSGPANGEYDLQFYVYDALSDGSWQALVAIENVVVEEGLFTVLLNAGDATVDKVAEGTLRFRTGPAPPNPSRGNTKGAHRCSVIVS